MEVVKVAVVKTTIVIREDLLKQLKILAITKNKTVSLLIEEAVRFYLEEKENPAPFLREQFKG